MEKNGEEWENILLQAIMNGFVKEEKRKDIPPVVIVGLGLPRFFREKLVGFLRKTREVGKFHVGKYHDTDLAVVFQGVGSVDAEITTRVLAGIGVRTVIGVGLVGGLQANIDIGSIILPTHALRGEATTSYYASKDFKAVPSPLVQAALERAVGSKTVLHEGKIFTTPVMIKEDNDLISRLSGEGVLGIECECSTMFVVSKLHGVEAGAGLLVTDKPVEKLVWSSPQVGERIAKGFPILAEAAFEAARSLTNKPEVSS